MKKTALLFFFSIGVLTAVHAQDLAYNALRVGGRTMNYEEISFMTIGKITMTLNQLSIEKPIEKVYFKVYLMRNNQIINNEVSSDKREFSEFEISQILEYANYGDQLIIESTEKSTIKTKRVFNLPKSLFNFNLGRRQEGC